LRAETIDPEFETLLEYLRQNRGFDFNGYKRASLMRRVEKRMQAVGCEGFADYLDYLQVHPSEFEQLFNTILINVTSFLRDREAWDFLQEEIVPRLIARKSAREPIRIWSAGCASGEEAYSLAIVMCEALGIDQYRDRVKIYATDVDEEALSKSRLGTFNAKEISGLPERLLEKYFEKTDDRYTFRKELRRSIIFGRNDLIQDAPISRLDLLVCRNVLMYFTAETQARILARFHFALNDGGILFLGRAETLFSHNAIFAPIDLKWRVFSKIPRANGRDRFFLAAPNGGDGGNANEVATDQNARLRDAAFELNAVAQIVVDAEGILTLVNEVARRIFGIDARDVGRPIRDMEVSYRPTELRSLLDRCYSERRTVFEKGVEWVAPGAETRTVDIQVAPLTDTERNVLGASVIFTDVTTQRRLQVQLEHSTQELETAYEELQSTNEELETTNEELQSTVEELETTNEELQSTNEELETMNEELQSTNVELQTINDELRRRTDETNHLNAFLESILTSMRGAVVVLDRDMNTLAWNRRAEDLWGARQEEVIGKSFLNLDIGLPVEKLKQPVRACLSGESDYLEIEMDATNRRGKPIVCRIAATPMVSAGGETRGVILLMEDNQVGDQG
jgi:two-component system CheB/CheR fusion protein